jgi:uncharacterized protein (TIGR02147 family)
MKKMKTIFEYTDYREFLRDMYAFKKATDPKFSFRNFSRSAGFKSSNILNLVMKGHRNIGARSVEKFSKGFKLKSEEAEFFQCLVQFNQASTAEEKQKFAEALVKFKSYQKIYPVNESQFNYFNRWYYIPIREMISLPSFHDNPQEIAQRLTPPITPAEAQQAQQALQELERLGLIKKDGSGRFVQTTSHIESPDAITLGALAKCHQDFIRLGSESIDQIQRDKREIMSITFPMPLALLPKFKEMMKEFRNSLVEASHGSDSDSVFQLNLQLFPIVDGSAKTTGVRKKAA